MTASESDQVILQRNESDLGVPQEIASRKNILERDEANGLMQFKGSERAGVFRDVQYPGNKPSGLVEGMALARQIQ